MAAMVVGRVAELWRFPVKSTLGERVPAAVLRSDGLEGDRRWAVVDGEGRAVTAKVERRLLEARARLEGDRPVLTLPDGTEVAAGDPSADDAVSAWLGRPLRLERADRAAPRTFRMHEDPLDESSPVAEFACPLGTFLDVAAAHLLTTSSLAAARRLQEGDWDTRRFRPTALLEVAGEGFVEDGWVGAEVRLGEAVTHVWVTTTRCAMPARAQDGLPRDADVIRALTRVRDMRLGVYAAVVADGVVAEGDEVAVDPA